MANSTIKLVQENIKKYRIIKGFTREELSETAGISSDYLSEIERGKKVPSLKRLILIAEALEIPCANLFQENI